MTMMVSMSRLPFRINIFSCNQGQDVALPEPGGAVEGHRPEAPDLAEPPNSRPAGGEHFDYLGNPKKAFPKVLPLPELGRASAAGQNGLAVFQGEGWVKFKGGFD